MIWWLIALTVQSVLAAASPPTDWKMSLTEAESLALQSSNDLKAHSAIATAAGEHADAQFANLLPRLTLDGSYLYDTHVPIVTLPLPTNPSFQFGAHDTYSFGPTLSYTLWDTGASRDAYHGYRLLEEARKEDRRNVEIQTLLAVRTAYLRLQLALEEMRLLNSSLNLSRAQNHDIESNYRGGAATKLDLVDSQRDVINYQLQFQQKQAEVEADFKDLLALVQGPQPVQTVLPGPPGIPGVEMVLHLDTLDRSMQEADRLSFAPPDDLTPEIRSQALQAEANSKLASSQRAAIYPIVQVSASAKEQYPDAINLQQVEQNSFMATISMPLFEGDRSRHLAAETERQADAARFSEQQMRINLLRDYNKSLANLLSLKQQRQLAAQDVERSETAAKLYYQSYKGGKINLIDVQSANNRALTSKVNAARISAQILSQVFNLQSLSGGKIAHGQ